jgi:hypothetical protein
MNSGDLLLSSVLYQYLYHVIFSCERNTHAGSIVDRVCPDFDATNSLLIKRPVGWRYCTEFGAVNETCILTIVRNSDARFR